MIKKLMLFILSVFILLGVSNAYVEDDFNRDSSSTLGVASNGNTWTEWETGINLGIANNGLSIITGNSTGGQGEVFIDLYNTNPDQVTFQYTIDYTSSPSWDSSVKLGSPSGNIIDCTAVSNEFVCFDGGGVHYSGIDVENITKLSFENIDYVSNEFDLIISYDVNSTYNVADLGFRPFPSTITELYISVLALALPQTIADNIETFNYSTMLGCTDIEADNYNSSAHVDDGSCDYSSLPYTIEDNFNRPDQSELGTATNGNDWVKGLGGDWTGVTVVNGYGNVASWGTSEYILPISTTNFSSIEFDLNTAPTIEMDIFMINKIFCQVSGGVPVISCGGFGDEQSTPISNSGFHTYTFEKVTGTNEVWSTYNLYIDDVLALSDLSTTYIGVDDVQLHFANGVGEVAIDNIHTYLTIYGCTDLEATNYNSQATEDDGSCTYQQYIPPPWFGGGDDEEDTPIEDDEPSTPEPTVCQDSQADNFGEEEDCVYNCVINYEGFQAFCSDSPDTTLPDTPDGNETDDEDGNLFDNIIDIFTPEPEKEKCAIVITPNNQVFTQDGFVVKYTIENDEDFSYTPDYKFNDVEGEDSAKSSYRILNAIGTIQPHGSKDVGVAFTVSSFNPVQSQDEFTLFHSVCADESVTLFSKLSNKTIEEDLAMGGIFGNTGGEDTPQAMKVSKIIDDLFGTELSDSNIGSFLSNIGLVVVMALLMSMFVSGKNLVKGKTKKAKSNRTIIRLLVSLAWGVFLVYVVRTLFTLIL